MAINPIHLELGSDILLRYFPICSIGQSVGGMGMANPFPCVQRKNQRGFFKMGKARVRTTSLNVQNVVPIDQYKTFQSHKEDFPKLKQISTINFALYSPAAATRMVVYIVQHRGGHFYNFRI